MIKKYNQYIEEKSFDLNIFEKLSINKELEDLVYLCRKQLQGKKEYVLRTNYKGKDISIIFKIMNMKNKHGYFSVVDKEKHIFKIVIDDINSGTLSHELKHLDRSLLRNYKSDKYEHYRIMINFLPHRSLFKNGTLDDVLKKTIYYFTPEEFEAHYVGIYHDLKELIKDDMSIDEKKNIINEYLSNSDIYFFYKFFYNKPFDLEQFFKNNRNLNFYIKSLFDKINALKNKNDLDKVININDFFHLLYKSYLNVFKNKFISDEKEISKFVKMFNDDINKVIVKGFKKLNRLYSLFI